MTCGVRGSMWSLSQCEVHAKRRGDTDRHTQGMVTLCIWSFCISLFYFCYEKSFLFPHHVWGRFCHPVLVDKNWGQGKTKNLYLHFGPHRCFGILFCIYSNGLMIMHRSSDHFMENLKKFFFPRRESDSTQHT